MAVPVGFTTIYSGIITGRSREMVLMISQRDTIVPLPSQQTVKYGRALVWKYDTIIGGKIEKGLMPGHTTLLVQDPLKQIFLHLSSARINGADDLDFHVDISGSGVALEGFIRLKNVDTIERHDVQVPVLKLQVYDGSGQVDRLQQLALSFSMGGMLADALFTTLLKLVPFTWRFDFGAKNIPAAQFLIDLISTTADVDWEKERQYKKRIQLIWEIFSVRIWQGFDGQWHQEQPHLMGQAGNVLSDPIFGSPTLVATDADIFDLLPRHFEEGLRRRLRDPIVSVEITRTIKDRQQIIGAIDSPLVSNFMIAGGFDNAFNRPLEHWLGVGTGGSGTIDSRGRSGQCLHLEEDQANEQQSMWVSGGELIQLMLHLYWAVENVSSAGNKSAHIQITWEPWNTVLDAVQYLDANGNFTTVPTTLATPVQPLDANGADPLTYYAFFVTVLDRAPVTGRFNVRFIGSDDAGAGGGYNTVIDDVLFHPVNPDSDDGTGKPARVQEIVLKTKLFAFDALSGVPVQGQTVKLEHELAHVSWVLEATGVPVGAFLFEFLEFNFFQTVTTPNRYSLDFWQYNGADYKDVVEMIYQYYRDLFGTYLWEIFGTIKEVLPPERSIRNTDGVPYFMLSSSIDLVKDQTNGVWVENKLAAVAFSKVVNVSVVHDLTVIET